MKYHHIGIPTKEKLIDEIYLDKLKIYVSGYGKNPYGIEWVRYEDNADFPDLVKKLPHVAFEVDNIEEAIQGKNVIIKPNSPSPGILVAFIEDNGVPIELLQIDSSISDECI